MNPVDRLLADPPRVHTDHTGRVHGDWALALEVLRFIAATVGAGDHTLETGLGLSTALFAALGTRHTVITPAAAEVDRLRTYCVEREIPLDGLDVHIGPSQQILPAAELPGLDLVLIDGSHAFPVPFLDWYHCAGPLRIGGLLIVDDTQLWTGAVLRDFLVVEPGWRLARTLDRASVFRKVGPHDPATEWTSQPYVTGRSLLWRDGGWGPFHEPPE